MTDRLDDIENGKQIMEALFLLNRTIKDLREARNEADSKYNDHVLSPAVDLVNTNIHRYIKTVAKRAIKRHFARNCYVGVFGITPNLDKGSITCRIEIQFEPVHINHMTIEFSNQNDLHSKIVSICEWVERAPLVLWNQVP